MLMVYKKSSSKYVKTVKPEQSTQSTGYWKYEANLEKRFENLEIGTRKNREVKCTYNLFICEEIWRKYPAIYRKSLNNY